VTQWDIPKLRVLLDKIIPELGTMEDYEVEHEFPGLGTRTMLLNARQVFYEGGAGTTILLGIEDITERRILERAEDELLQQKDAGPLPVIMKRAPRTEQGALVQCNMP
jgi:hypothetical protein